MPHKEIKMITFDDMFHIVIVANFFILVIMFGYAISLAILSIIAYLIDKVNK